MRTCAGLVLFLCFAAVASAETTWTIECRGELGVPALEKPGSIVVIRFLSCGDNVTVVGSDRGYARIQIGKTVTAFVDEKYIRPADEKVSASQSKEQAANRKEEAQRPGATSTADRDQSKKAQHSSRPKRAFLSGLEIGMEVSPTKYRQYRQIGEIATEEIMEEGGTLPGVYGAYTFRPKRILLRPEGRFSFGNVGFVNPGYLDSAEHIDGVWNNFVETRCILGWDFKVSENARLTPIAGLGYRYQYDGMGGKKDRYGNPFNDRKSHYLYSPIGMEWMVGVGGGWSLGASVEYDQFWRGWLHSEYGDSNPELPTMANTQKNGWGARGSVRIVKRFGKRELIFAPFIRHWDIKESEIGSFMYGGFATEYQEPPSKSTEWGASLGVKF